MTAAAPNPILVPLGRALEAMLNRLLALDPEAAARLAPLEARTLEFGWQPAGLGLRVQVNAGKFVLGPRGGEGSADLAMEGSLAGFLRLALPEWAPRLPPGKVAVSGDAELARELEKLLRNFRPDPVDGIERNFGAEAGAIASRIAGAVLPRLRAALATVPLDLANYVRDERGDAVAREELEDFAADVDRLRDDVERIAARVANLKPDRSGNP